MGYTGPSVLKIKSKGTLKLILWVLTNQALLKTEGRLKGLSLRCMPSWKAQFPQTKSPEKYEIR